MPIVRHPLSAVTEADLQALITGGLREGRTLDFKRESYGTNDEARAEFLADISALANTLGGDLVLGVEEDQGVAVALPGLRARSDADQEILRLTQMAQSGLQPRLPNLEMHAVPVWVDDLAKQFLNQLFRVLPALRHAEVDPPYSVQLTMSGVRGATFMAQDDFHSSRGLHRRLPVERDVLFFTDAIIAEDDLTRDQVATALRPTLDQLYRTGSYDAAPVFKSDGSLRWR